MKITMQVRELRAVAGTMSKCINRLAAVEALRHVRVVAGVDPQRVTMTGTDLENVLVYTFTGATVDRPGELLVPWAGLCRIVRACRAGDMIALESSCADEVVIGAHLNGRAVQTRLETWPVDEFPTITAAENWTACDVGALMQAVRKAAPCRSIDPRRHVLRHVFADTGAGAAVATDGRQIVSVPMPVGDMPKPWLIDPKLILAGIFRNGAIDGFVSFDGASDGGWWALKAGSWTCMMKLSDGSYPAWGQCVPSARLCVNRVKISDDDRAVIADVARFVLKTRKTDRQYIMLYAAAEGVALVVRDGESARSACTALPLTGGAVNGLAEPLLVAVRAEFWQRAAALGVKTIRCADAYSPLRFECPGDVLYVVMPIRDNEHDRPMAIEAAARKLAETQTVES
jgi:DNA polymerase III sliding clamp (beta) subunit (PCNA family)